MLKLLAMIVEVYLLKLSGTSVINGNHARQSDVGAILIECSTYGKNYVEFDNNITHYPCIINNTADGYGGGGILQFVVIVGEWDCFFRSKPTDEITETQLSSNERRGCNLWRRFRILGYTTVDITERNTSSALSSPPNKVCICSDDFPQRHTCLHFMQLDTYPGHRFQVPLVCVGRYNYSSSCKVQAHLEMTSIASIAEETTLQNIALECKQLYYSIETQQTNYTEILSLTIVKEQDSSYHWSNQKMPEIRVKA